MSFSLCRILGLFGFYTENSGFGRILIVNKIKISTTVCSLYLNEVSLSLIFSTIHRNKLYSPKLFLIQVKLKEQLVTFFYILHVMQRK